jgi:hypothetical protein
VGAKSSPAKATVRLRRDGLSLPNSLHVIHRFPVEGEYSPRGPHRRPARGVRAARDRRLSVDGGPPGGGSWIGGGPSFFRTGRFPARPGSSAPASAREHWIWPRSCGCTRACPSATAAPILRSARSRRRARRSPARSRCRSTPPVCGTWRSSGRSRRSRDPPPRAWKRSTSAATGRAVTPRRACGRSSPASRGAPTGGRWRRPRWRRWCAWPRRRSATATRSRTRSPWPSRPSSSRPTSSSASSATRRRRPPRTRSGRTSWPRGSRTSCGRACPTRELLACADCGTLRQPAISPPRSGAC